MAEAMTIPEIIVLLVILAICIYGLVQWSVERRRADWQRLQDQWEDGWPS